MLFCFIWLDYIVKSSFSHCFYFISTKVEQQYGAPFVKILYLTDLAQKLLSLHAEILSLAEIAISACRDVISGRDSYLCMQRCYLWQRQLSLHAEMLSLPEIAISACRDVISGRDSYLCMQRCYLWQR